MRRDCIPASHLVPSPNTAIASGEEIIERAKAYSLGNYEEPALNAAPIIWIDTSEDETRWEGQSVAARVHREARETGLPRYAVVWLHVRDRLGTEQDRQLWMDQCGNPLR